MRSMHGVTDSRCLRIEPKGLRIIRLARAVRLLKVGRRSQMMMMFLKSLVRAKEALQVEKCFLTTPPFVLRPWTRHITVNIIMYYDRCFSIVIELIYFVPVVTCSSPVCDGRDVCRCGLFCRVIRYGSRQRRGLVLFSKSSRRRRGWAF